MAQGHFWTTRVYTSPTESFQAGYANVFGPESTVLSGLKWTYNYYTKQGKKVLTVCATSSSAPPQCYPQPLPQPAPQPSPKFSGAAKTLTAARRATRVANYTSPFAHLGPYGSQQQTAPQIPRPYQPPVVHGLGALDACSNTCDKKWGSKSSKPDPFQLAACFAQCNLGGANIPPVVPAGGLALPGGYTLPEAWKIPGGWSLPSEWTLPAGVPFPWALPAGTTWNNLPLPPPGTVLPGGFTMPDLNAPLPGGLTFPGFTLPAGWQLPGDWTLPKGWEVPAGGLTLPAGMPLPPAPTPLEIPKDPGVIDPKPQQTTPAAPAAAAAAAAEKKDNTVLWVIGGLALVGAALVLARPRSEE